jgi:hypothetical protein
VMKPHLAHLPSRRLSGTIPQFWKLFHYVPLFTPNLWSYILKFFYTSRTIRWYSTLWHISFSPRNILNKNTYLHLPKHML